MEEKFVTITEDEYLALKDEVMFLNILEAYGVDNWSGYDDAKDEWRDRRAG